MKPNRLRVLVLLTALACAPATIPARQAPPPNTEELPTVSDAAAESLLVDVRALDPTIQVEMRYATTNNFTGAVIPGYEGNRAFLRREAAQALARAQRRAIDAGYTLRVYDAYRPVRATLAMVDWTQRVGREDLLRDGYIASRSRHNLGLAIDLTLIEHSSGRALAMGTAYDTFSAAAHTANATGDVARNRGLLKRFMEAEGFINYDKEWWHFSYDLPNPVRFDKVVR
jgi:D-alanyl-D-alanine dipeptidase